MAVTLADLEERFGPVTIRGLLDFSGTGAGVAARATTKIAEAVQIADNRLKAGWTDPVARAAIIENDIEVRGAIMDIAAFIMARPQSSTGGAGPGAPGSPYYQIYKVALEVLDAKGKAGVRTTAEELSSVGPNAHVGAEPMVQSIPAAVPGQRGAFIFGGHGSRSRNPGGF